MDYDYEKYAVQEKIDAVRNASQAGAIIGGPSAGNACLKPTDFNDLLARIRRATMEAREAAAHSNRIAGIIHGQEPECEEGSGNPMRSGLIGQYEDALDELASALSNVRSNLRRISKGIPEESQQNAAQSSRPI